MVVTVFNLLFGFICIIIFGIIHAFEILTPTNTWQPLALSIYTWSRSALRLVPIFSFLYGYQKVYILSIASGMCRFMDDASTLKFTCAKIGKILEKAKNGEVLSDIETQLMIMAGCCEEFCAPNCYGVANAFQFGNLGAGVELANLFSVGLATVMLIVLYECKYRGR